jgi:hypothetical protein
VRRASLACLAALSVICANCSEPHGTGERSRDEKYFDYMTKIQNAERKLGDLCRKSSNFMRYGQGTFKADTQILIFAFPDGVMGGLGKIVGGRQQNTLSDSQCGQLEFEKCARVQFYEEDNWSHVTFLLTPSSQNDQKIVDCAVKHLAGRFNVGYASSTPGDFVMMNETAFTQLHQHQAKKENAQTH